ncbi:MAG: PilT/PilU family type 4a pilus ATPase [bacterium]|nr:PilT/PilU family type 4a pilus ATPase [bacterium]
MSEDSAGQSVPSELNPGSAGGPADSEPHVAARMDKYFRSVVKMRASDLHLKAGTEARVRLDGRIRSLQTEPFTSQVLEEMLREILSPEQLAAFEEHGACDFARQVGENRFRINAFRQRGLTSVAARRIPKEILSYAELNLPVVLERLADHRQGLILLTGITGSGKSTTIASMIQQINEQRACHIVTIEDPIEYVYEDRKAFVNQREIGLDVADFHSALKYLMRQDPDVVLIGELRDHETFAAALQAAESGHLCFGTIHASSCAGAITRMLELFPEDARALVRSSLEFNLQAIICQKLLPGDQEDVPLIPAVEIMIANSTVRKLIGEGRDKDINGVIKNSYNEGMIDFTESLRRLVETEMISAKVAYEHAPNPEELKMRLKGISVSSGGIIG